jgi:hypothetical protein
MSATHHEYGSYIAVGAAALLSAAGWISAGKWLPADSAGLSFGVAILRTIFTLLPAAVAWWIATRRQRRVHQELSNRLDVLKASLASLDSLESIENELETMNRLASVSRAAVKDTAVSANELLRAIELVPDDITKERLVDRFRNHSTGLRTVLSAVNDELEDSGRRIAKQLSAEEEIHILEREERTNTQGIEFARKLAEQRGLIDGVRQLTEASDQARQLQLALSSLTKDQVQERLTK